MKKLYKIIIVTCWLLFISIQTQAQNQLPIITNWKTTHDVAKKEILINFDVADKEDSEVNIQLFSMDKNQVKTKILDATGDIGGITTGKNKKIIWNYTDNQSFTKVSEVIVSADDYQRQSVNDLLQSVNINRIEDNVKKIYGFRDCQTPKGNQHLAEVRSLVNTQFAQHQLKVERQSFKWEKIKGENVVSSKDANSESKKIFVVGAHMDAAKDSPGGDDNATGLAGLLEVMHILSDYNFNHQILFAGFDCEEIGFLGSKYFVNDALEQKKQIEGMVNFDMIGSFSDLPNTQMIPQGFDALFPDVAEMVAKDSYKGNFVVCTSNQASEALGINFKEKSEQYLPTLKVASLVALENGEFTPTLASSDHAPFWKANFKAIHIGDGGETRNPKLNTPEDTLEGVNYRFISEIVKATIAIIAELAEIQHSTQIKIELNAAPQSN